MSNIDTGKCKVLSIQDIEPSPFNARDQQLEPITSEAFQELCESLKTEGLVEPIVVRHVGAGRYETIAGTRRLRALKHVGAMEVPVVVRQMNDNDVRVASLVENIHRHNLGENELERTLKEIYLSSWDDWKPVGWDLFLPKMKDKRTGKAITYDLKSTEGQLTLAKQYLGRIANEESKAVISNSSRIRNQPKAGDKSKGIDQFVFPTEAFRDLVSRVGYSPIRQKHIIAGYGSGSNKRYFDYWEEMAPVSRRQFEEDQRIKALAEEKKRDLARRQREALRKAQKARKKTNKEVVEEVTDRFFKNEETKKQQKKKKQEEREKKRQQEEREEKEKLNKITKQEQEEEEEDEEQEQQQKENEPKPYVEKAEKETNPVRARQEIAGLATKLFKLLTSQDLDIGNLKIGEMQAKSLAATENMKEVASFYATEQTRAWQQYIIVPLSIVIDKYRDILHDAVEEAHRQDDMMRP